MRREPYCHARQTATTKTLRIHHTRPVRRRTVAHFSRFRTPLIPLHYCKNCVSLTLSKRREKFRGRRRGALERSQIGVDRTVPGPCQGYRLTRSANRIAERADQLPDDAPQVPRERPCIPARFDHDGQQAPSPAGLSYPP